VITVVTGAALQLTHAIDLQERVAEQVGWNLWVRFIDFGFRNLAGALVLVVLFSRMFGFLGTSKGFRDYGRHLRLNAGPSPRLTRQSAAASGLILVALLIALAGWLDVLRLDPDFWIRESRWFILILALVPGVWEELAFRGLMLSNLEQRYPRWVAIVASAVLFGLMHFTNLMLREPAQVLFEVIMATSVGVAWGYLTVKTGSVVPAMFMHYLMNVLIELILAPELSETASAVVFGSVTIAYPILTILATWWLARRAMPQGLPDQAEGVRAELVEIAGRRMS
jgi:membrane protease YdiL (CAAX protease family)